MEPFVFLSELAGRTAKVAKQTQLSVPLAAPHPAAQAWPWWLMHSWLQLMHCCSLCSPFFQEWSWKTNGELPVECNLGQALCEVCWDQHTRWPPCTRWDPLLLALGCRRLQRHAGLGLWKCWGMQKRACVPDPAQLSANCPPWSRCTVHPCTSERMHINALIGVAL